MAFAIEGNRFRIDRKSPKIMWSWLIIFNLTAYNSQKLFKFYNHFPHDMEMCRTGDFFKVLLKFKKAATDQLHIFSEAQKLKLKVKLFKMNNHIST